MKISIQENDIIYDKAKRTFLGDGNRIPFATRYEMVNDETGKSNVFDFVHSTGSEWDKDTKWVYACTEGKGFIFVLSSEDQRTLNVRKRNYIKAKMR